MRLEYLYNVSEKECISITDHVLNYFTKVQELIIHCNISITGSCFASMTHLKKLSLSNANYLIPQYLLDLKNMERININLKNEREWLSPFQYNKLQNQNPMCDGSFLLWKKFCN